MTTSWTDLLDLAADRLGGIVLAASDTFFAPPENLLKEAEPVSLPDRFTARGKWMDGWETRRRRDGGHDWCLVRLGLPGAVRGLVVDTTHFRGNAPQACSVEACAAPGYPTAEEVLAPAVPWTEILPRSPLEPDRRNPFAVEVPWRFTHLLLRIFPDGGVARLRVHGEAVPGAELARRGRELDLAAAEHGGRVLATSDAFFGAADRLILPGLARGMGDGWETRRRRGPGSDWALLALAGEGIIHRVEVDTLHFRGNAPESCSLEGIRAPELAAGQAPREDGPWQEILPRTRLLPHQRHLFAHEVAPHDGLTHARLRIHPDGGVGRLRLWGRLSEEGRRAVGLRILNALEPAAARRELLTCCGSRRWAARMAAARPFSDPAALEEGGGEVWWDLEPEDWLEALAAHPRIGERPEASSRWSAGEQARALEAGEEARRRLADANRAYEERFGHTFIVDAAGKGAEEILGILEERLGNDPETELRVAAQEQAHITRRRLRRLLEP